jgi:hypothetical protein
MSRILVVLVGPGVDEKEPERVTERFGIKPGRHDATILGYPEVVTWTGHNLVDDVVNPLAVRSPAHEIARACTEQRLD